MTESKNVNDRKNNETDRLKPSKAYGVTLGWFSASILTGFIAGSWSGLVIGIFGILFYIVYVLEFAKSQETEQREEI